MNAAGQQLSDHGIGASEISAVVGLNPYRSAFELWEEKVGEREPFEGNDATTWGLLTEDAIRKAYALKTGRRLIKPTRSLFHPEISFARATPDAIVVNDNAPIMVPGYENDVPTQWWEYLLQLKNTGYWPGKAWDQGPPDFVVLQEQWEMFVAGAARGAPIDRADVAACIGGGFPVFFTVLRDDAMIAGLVKVAADFWRRVETRTPPDADDSEACRQHWLRRARAGAALLVPYVEARDVADEFRAAWHDKRRAERRLGIAKSRVAEVCGLAEAGGIELDDGAIKLQERKGKRSTNWNGVASLLAERAGMTPAQLDKVIDGFTKTGAASTAVVAPRSWGEES